MPYPPFSPPYYVRYPCALRRKSASQCAHRSMITAADAASSLCHSFDAQYPYMDVAEAYDAAAAAAQGGYVGAGAFALPPSPLLTPSMIGTLLPFSPMGSMSPLSPPGAMPLPPLYALPDGGASYDPQEALAQFQAQQMMMTSPRAFGPAGPYALAPQMYDAYDTGDALPSPRQHMQARTISLNCMTLQLRCLTRHRSQAQQAFGAGRGRGLMPRTGRSGMVVPPPLPQAQQQPRAEAVAGAPAGASPPSPRAAEPSLMRAGSGGGSSSSAPAAMSATAASASSAPEGGATLRARRMVRGVRLQRCTHAERC